MLTPAVSEPAAANRDRLRRRHRPAGAALVDALPPGLAADRPRRRSVRADRTRDRPVGLPGVVAAEDRRAGDEHVRAGARCSAARSRRRSRRRPAPPPRRRRSPRRAPILSSECAMKACPPQPGLTVMHSAMSIAPATSASAPTGVAGLIATPTPTPRLAHQSRRVGDVRRGLGVEGDRVRARLDEVAGHGARGARSSGARRASRRRRAPARAAPSTTSGPTVIGGTKCPSITSTWITCAPASSTSPTCSRSRAKSADRIDGATCTPRAPSALIWLGASSRRSCCTS